MIDTNGPVITGQPQSAIAGVSSNASFTVTASGLAPLSYQWVKDGTPLSGATDTSYNLSNIQIANQGAYWVVVTNTHGSVTSDVATLTVLVNPPKITIQPQDLVSLVNTSATFGVTVQGSAPFSYQWFFENAPIAGATGSAYTIPSVQTNNEGGYSVVITNSSGSVTSDVATLTVFA